MVGRKAFPANPNHQYHVSQNGEQDCSANNKRNGDYYEFPSLSLFMKELWLKGKWWKEMLFLQIKSINIVHPNEVNMIVVPITRRMEIITSIQVELISRMNFDYEENGRRKALLANEKHQYHVSQCGEHDCRANNRKNGGY